MVEKVGVFLNNTNSNVKYCVNLNNIKQCYNNFDKIYIIDNIDNEFSLRLRENLGNFKLTYYRSHIKDKISQIIYMINKIQKFDLITFIDDDYIILDKLNFYFKFIEETDYDLYSYTDSSEDFYHYCLNIFSFRFNIYDKMKNLCKNSSNIYDINNKDNVIGNKNKFLKFLVNLDCKKSVFLKVAYMDTIYGKNIFNEFNDYYEELLKNNILPILDYKLLKYFHRKFDEQILVLQKIPEDFDINVYRKYKDLNGYDDEFLKNHFMEHGQFECRSYKENDYILPVVIYNKLNSINLIQYFDFPINFDFNTYKYNNGDLNKLNKIQLKNHWFEYGVNEDRIITLQ